MTLFEIWNRDLDDRHLPRSLAEVGLLQTAVPTCTYACCSLEARNQRKKCSRGYVRSQSFFQLPVSKLHEERGELREKASCAQSIDAWPQAFNKKLTRGVLSHCLATAVLLHGRFLNERLRPYYRFGNQTLYKFKRNGSGYRM